jgi:hypothetical protein
MMIILKATLSEDLYTMDATYIIPIAASLAPIVHEVLVVEQTVVYAATIADNCTLTTPVDSNSGSLHHTRRLSPAQMTT